MKKEDAVLAMQRLGAIDPVNVLLTQKQVQHVLGVDRSRLVNLLSKFRPQEQEGERVYSRGALHDYIGRSMGSK